MKICLRQNTQRKKAYKVNENVPNGKGKKKSMTLNEFE